MKKGYIVLLALTWGFSHSISFAVTLADYPYTISPDPTRYATEVDQLVFSDKINPPPEGAVVGIGSSSMRMWKPRIHDDLAGLTVIPRGFGGSHFTDAIYYAQKLVLKYKPRAMLVYEGDNDSNGGKSPERIRDDLAFFVDYCRTTLPDLRVYVISVKPAPARKDIWESVVQPTNGLLKAYCDQTDGVTYIDVGSGMFNSSGVLRSDIFISDGIHLNNTGYDIWAAAIAPVMLDMESSHESTEPCTDCNPSPDVINIDFGGMTMVPGWNFVTDAAKDGSGIQLIDSSGKQTPVSLKAIEAWNRTVSNGFANGTRDFIADATVDSILGNDLAIWSNVSPNPTIEFSGLDPEAAYNLRIYASRVDTSENRSTQFTATGLKVVTGLLDPANNETGSLTLPEVAPDGLGKLIFDFKKAPANNSYYGFIHLGAMIIEKTNPYVETWGEYSSMEGHVDTGDFLGWIYVQGDWIWMYSLENYFYLPEDFLSPSGSWTYIHNFREGL